MPEHNESKAVKQTKQGGMARIGVVLIIISCLFYAAILLVPLLGFSAGTKIAITGGLVVAGEATFWIGGIILGKEAMSRYRKNLNPLSWFKARKD